MSFEAWMKKVDASVSARAGIGASDLPDGMYRDAYDDEMSPKDAATEALLAADYPPELL